MSPLPDSLIADDGPYSLILHYHDGILITFQSLIPIYDVATRRPVALVFKLLPKSVRMSFVGQPGSGAYASPGFSLPILQSPPPPPSDFSTTNTLLNDASLPTVNTCLCSTALAPRAEAATSFRPSIVRPHAISQARVTVTVIETSTTTTTLTTTPTTTPAVIGGTSTTAAAPTSAQGKDSIPQIPQNLNNEGLIVTQPETRMLDPLNAAFLGGAPSSTVDVPITAIFLVLFGLGAFVHITIYRANAKRGHKFLLSDLVFDFCMVRVVTCIFRIVLAFASTRGVVLAANIFQNGGAVVLFAVNLFFGQRLVRAMHPSVGWHPVFSYFSLSLIFSVPVVTVLNIVVISVSFFSAGQADRLHTAEKLLKLGSSWNMMLVTMPLVWMFLASAVPGQPPEKFGTGQFRAKATLLVFSAVTLAAGAAVRLAALSNPESPAAMSTLFSKPVFYITQFLLEFATVAAYAAFRVDSLFHVPNGASGPGQYCAKKLDGEKGGGGGARDGTRSGLTHREIERELEKLGIRYEILSERGANTERGPLLALLHQSNHVHDRGLGISPVESEVQLGACIVHPRARFQIQDPTRFQTSDPYVMVIQASRPKPIGKSLLLRSPAKRVVEALHMFQLEIFAQTNNGGAGVPESSGQWLPGFDCSTLVPPWTESALPNPAGLTPSLPGK
ncbi:hypothetical protein C2857_007873 [Epichloe festucae Fl1]|uniref:Uncharacterized protein n=1 Tax=Epichloe festucae (strain Fl1) TaxID=877507 RepID=A0A7S9KMV9_EPIFF|nr:hypothetical protein C2857_007873 [Epichloe festucae Fl1]